MSSPVPKSPEQSEKCKKYDRQLRLWGDHGQKCLENAKVCLINATALGSEIMKSLVLPGIGSFTIVDGEKVTDDDVGSNFFVDFESVGMSRAQTVTQNLLELNPDVQGDYIDETLEHVMKHSQDFFDSFSVVIGTGLPERILINLSNHLWEKNVPLVVGHSVGFSGYIRIQVKEHTTIETHPDSETLDLRLDKPWPALQKHLEQVDISKLDTKERSHVPAIVILYYYLKQFKTLHGHWPSTRTEKDELRKLVYESPFPDEHGIKLVEQNFREAIHYFNTCSYPVIIPSNIKDILNDDSCINLTENSSPFWILCAALKEYIETECCLPLKGRIPDMTTDTDSYITLQQLYQKEAQSQAEIVYRQAMQIARNLGYPQEIINENETKLFCKHASELNVIRGSCIANEFQKMRLDLHSYLEDSDSLMFHYITLRGLQRFLSEYNTHPGHLDDHVEPDVLKLKSMIGKLLSECGCSQIVCDERIHELCRYGGTELNCISAVLGGCAAQEVVKIITRQYKLLNNTFIYDSITSSSATFTL